MSSFTRGELFHELKYIFDRFAKDYPDLAISIALTQIKLHKAVEAEKYEEAAIHRDKLKEFYQSEEALESLPTVEDYLNDKY
tara:strand:- start:277 stop:522 length:246 start_codon:yes stop_codon:yes gene_type:complete